MHNALPNLLSTNLLNVSLKSSKTIVRTKELKHEHVMCQFHNDIKIKENN